MSESDEAKVDQEEDSGSRAPEERVRGRRSGRSNDLIAASHELLGMAPSAAASLPSPISLPPPPVRNGLAQSASSLLRSRSPSPAERRDTFAVPSPRVPPSCLLNQPKFKRVDFDDRVYEEIEDKKPTWKKWQDSVSDSFYTAKRQVEKNKEDTDFLENTLLSRPRVKRGESPFRNLDSESFLPRKSSWLANGAMNPRDRVLASSPSVSSLFAGSGPYAAPAVSRSEGVESTSYESRYEARANDIEARILKTTHLPRNLKTITRKEFRNAPAPAAGGPNDRDDYDFSMYAPRPYYSRPRRDDPDYFDFDLQHSVDLYRKPAYVPKRPQEWEQKLLGGADSKGSAPLSGYLFTKGDSDFRCSGSSLLSAALRTPKFWERRFESIGQQVRDSNPVSLDSINRNRPVSSRFTEYRDPDYDNYDDPRADD